MTGAHRKPDFLKVNPAGKLPALVDGDVTLTESVAIVLYLAEKHPEKGLLPRGLVERAEVYRWLLFTTTELEQPLWRISHHTSLYPKERRIPAEVVLAREDFATMAAVCDAHMNGRQFVAGDTVTCGGFRARIHARLGERGAAPRAVPEPRTPVQTRHAKHPEP
jgi:glutathione S-transferase